MPGRIPSNSICREVIPALLRLRLLSLLSGLDLSIGNSPSLNQTEDRRTEIEITGSEIVPGQFRIAQEIRIAGDDNTLLSAMDCAREAYHSRQRTILIALGGRIG